MENAVLVSKVITSAASSTKTTATYTLSPSHNLVIPPSVERLSFISLLDIRKNLKQHQVFGNVSNVQKQPSSGVLSKSVLKICSKFTGEHLCRSVISIKWLCSFIEITLRHECSPECSHECSSFVYNFVKTESTFPVQFQAFLKLRAGGLKTLCHGFFFLDEECFNMNTRKISSKQFHGPCVKSFDDLAKYRYFLRFP